MLLFKVDLFVAVVVVVVVVVFVVVAAGKYLLMMLLPTRYTYHLLACSFACFAQSIVIVHANRTTTHTHTLSHIHKKNKNNSHLLANATPTTQLFFNVIYNDK